MSDETHPEGTGRLLASRYRLTAVLGQGGMGTVWRAADEFLGRDVAVKELRFAAGVDEDEQHRLVARTLTEAKAIARVRHSAAVTVYDVVEEDNRPWIVMELVESRSLSEVIRTDGVLPPQRAAEVALELLGVLAEAHRVGILHRDVKPSNVLIGHDGRVVLTDFGIARVEGDPSVTSTGMLVGAPSYISPERARGGVPGPPADLWSLGATLYAMVEGVPPYDKGSALSTLTAVITEPVPLLGGGDLLLLPVVSGLLRKDPAERLDASTTRSMLRGVIGEYERRARATAPFGTPGAGGTADAAAASARTQALPAPQATRVQPPVPSASPFGTGSSGSAMPGGSGGPGGSSGPGGPTGPQGFRQPAASAASGAAAAAGAPPKRRPLQVAAVVVAAVLLVTAAVAAMNRGGTPGSGASQDGATSGSTSHPHLPAGASAGAGSSASAPGAVAGAGSTAKPDKDPALALGYRRVAGPGGSSIGIPDGWRQTVQSPTRFAWVGPAGTLIIDFTGHPRASGALKAWQDEEPRVAATEAEYRRLRLAQVGWRGWDTADWEWTFRMGAVQLHSLNRGFVVDAAHGYAIYWTAPETTWRTGRSATLLNDFFSSFEPAGG